MIASDLASAAGVAGLLEHVYYYCWCLMIVAGSRSGETERCRGEAGAKAGVGLARVSERLESLPQRTRFGLSFIHASV